ncbi:hypothetical protein AAFF_G00300090 [Aldrovandia affinis]|uniref:Uncharacterized protein n=1 Tax=Aldrovandia affinis TaxID=143900 RepID=A0AAD7SPV7_9TELE|nr:hypothetical protein AAFF_G00300090 [Aldrovandia affinis]
MDLRNEILDKQETRSQAQRLTGDRSASASAQKRAPWWHRGFLSPDEDGRAPSALGGASVADGFLGRRSAVIRSQGDLQTSLTDEPADGRSTFLRRGKLEPTPHRRADTNMSSQIFVWLLMSAITDQSCMQSSSDWWENKVVLSHHAQLGQLPPQHRNSPSLGNGVTANFLQHTMQAHMLVCAVPYTEPEQSEHWRTPTGLATPADTGSVNCDEQ